jgi:hypothetical protein
LLFDPLMLVAPLGLRLWDRVAAAQVTSGLHIVAAPQNRPQRSVAATASLSGIYAFAHLPDLRPQEHGAGDASYWAEITESQRRTYTLTVSDLQERFFDFTLSVRTPQRGIFAFACPDATVTLDAPNSAIPLFSLPSRPVPAGMAVIRCEVTRAGQPAAWAFVEVKQTTTLLGQGLCDEKGRAAVIFPHPTATGNVPLLEQSWTLTLNIYHTPLPNARTPVDLCAVLSQQESIQDEVTMTFGQELFVRIAA